MVPFLEIIIHTYMHTQRQYLLSHTYLIYYFMSEKKMIKLRNFSVILEMWVNKPLQTKAYLILYRLVLLKTKEREIWKSAILLPMQSFHLWPLCLSSFSGSWDLLTLMVHLDQDSLCHYIALSWINFMPPNILVFLETYWSPKKMSYYGSKNTRLKQN